jgi:pyruvate,water dikinase
VIRGSFDPFLWVEDPDRPDDFYIPGRAKSKKESWIIHGSPGSAGVVKGKIRRLESPEDGHQLQQGEIMLALQTDIAWTVLFPRAAAIVTDIGAPLSHAAIVARELGIPAVVGCGNAMSRLKSGDLVRVDGARGFIEIIHN